MAALLVLLALVLWAAPVLAQSPAELGKSLRKEIETKSRQAEETKQEVSRLSQEERKLFGELAGVEDQVQRLEREVKTQEQRLDDISKEQARLMADNYDIQRRKDRYIVELKGLIASIWPVHMRNIQEKLGKVQSWEEADRRFTWLAAIYSEARRKLDQVLEQEKLLAQNLAQQDKVRALAEDQLDRINGAKDKLLQSKLSLLASLKNIRSERQDQEAGLRQVLETINQLNYKLKILISKNFGAMRGLLPWPLKGKVVATFNPEAEPPVRGLGLACKEDEAVNAVFWGKVVHDDVLRGFGRVIILYHGNDYYSLYAFLSQSMVKAGQEVQKDQPIGKVGYYPEAKGPGLYFELRFHQKPINPQNWLTESR